MIRFPPPLREGDLIAVTAPSSGVTGPATRRLDHALANLRQLGFRVVEGECLRNEYKDTSAPAPRRAAELMRFLLDPEVAAVFPPWGGTRASELLDRMDFAALTLAPPKWFLGYSDLSTLHVPLVLIAGWGTAHGCNLMDLVSTQTDTLTAATLAILGHDLTQPFRQSASSRFQAEWSDFDDDTDAPFALTEVTAWKRLDRSTRPVAFEGRIIGGCLDTIAWLAGSKYGDLPAFIRDAGEEGVMLYFENATLAAADALRALLAMKRQGWFEGLRGVLIGRSATSGDDSPASLSYHDVLIEVLGSLPCPVIYDVDIGHLPPQLTIINGSHARVEFAHAGGFIEQTCRVNAVPHGSA